MRTALQVTLALSLTSIVAIAHARTPHRCDAAARLQAQSLLAFHLKGENQDAPNYEITVAEAVKTLPSAPNPASPKQRLDVLELWASAERGDFRIRLSFMPGGTSCKAVGQEIMNWASFN